MQAAGHLSLGFRDTKSHYTNLIWVSYLTPRLFKGSTRVTNLNTLLKSDWLDALAELKRRVR